MTVPERVRIFVRHKKISVSEFCRRLDVSSAYVSSMSKSMSLKVIQRISIVFPDLNILWLQTGEGEMIKRPEEEQEIIASIIPCRDCDRKDGKIEMLQETNRDLQKQLMDLQKQLVEMTALYKSEVAHSSGKKPGGGGGGGEDTPSSLRFHSNASTCKGKI